MFPVYLLYCLIALALQFSGGFKILTKTRGFFYLLLHFALAAPSGRARRPVSPAQM